MDRQVIFLVLYCSHYQDDCFCPNDDHNFELKYDAGLYCCPKTKEQCTYQDSKIPGNTDGFFCPGETLNLTQQCHNECNFYGFDTFRNSNAIRSYLDMCHNNKYEFNSQSLSLFLTMNNTCILFRTCVDETQLCMGKPLCENKNDLKWCKDVWDLSSPNFKYIYEVAKQKSVCNKTHQPENFVPNGQVINTEDIGNGLVYNCFNRADEDPFKKVANNQSEDEVDKSWSDWVRTPCGEKFRRCLGQKPSQCVFAGGGYI